MATIESYQDARGSKRYMVRYRTPQQTQTKKRGFRTKRDAEDFANTVDVRKLQGQLRSPVAGQNHHRRISPNWLSRNESDVAPSNYRMLESAWRIHVEPHWGSVRLYDIDLAEVETWIATMRRKSGATTVIRAYGVLAGILDDGSSLVAFGPIQPAAPRTCPARRERGAST